MEDIKVGDWVFIKPEYERELLPHQKSAFKVSFIDNYNNLYGEYRDLEYANASYCTKWVAKENEWCWFYNRHTEVPLLRRFEYIFNGRFYTNDEIMFDICEPFIGELPSFLKDKQCVILK